MRGNELERGDITRWIEDCNDADASRTPA
jgi:hypothetical protein